MRRILGGLAVFLGILGLVLGVRADAIYRTVAVAPLDQETIAVSEGTATGTLISAPDGKNLKVDHFTDATVRNTRVVKGIPGQVPADKRDDNAFWQLGLSTEVLPQGANKHGVLKQSIDGVSIDRRTTLASNCCKDFMSAGDINDPSRTVEMKHKGLFFTFPIGSEQHEYPFWDGDLLDAVPAKFVRTEQLHDLGTNVYVQEIPETDLAATTTTTVPRSLFGGGAGSVPAHQTYSNTRTFWVEPNTGIIIKAQENVEKALVSDAGKLTLIKGLIGYTPETQERFANRYRGDAKNLYILKNWLKPLGLLLGTLLTLAGLALLFGSRREPAGRHHAERAVEPAPVAAMPPPYVAPRQSATDGYRVDEQAHGSASGRSTLASEATMPIERVSDVDPDASRHHTDG